jgi:hypothetical protein
MTSSFPSPIEDLNAAIQSHNPFIDRGAVVRVQDIWAKGFPDLTTLNAHADAAIFRAIKQVSSGKGKVTSIAITGEQGVGKTHIISRIRQGLQNQASALLIYASASNFSDLNLINYQFLQTLSHSLSQVGSQGVKQWQEIGIAILIQAYKYVNKINQAEQISKHPKDLVENNFPSAIERNNKFIDSLTSVVLKLKPDSDPDIIRAILLTLSEPHAPYAIKWLSGNDLSESKAAELGLPNHVQEYREAKAFNLTLQILSLIVDHKSLLIVFDELEGVGLNETDLTKAQVVAELVKNLFDSLELSSSSQGIVISTLMLPDTWKFKIKVLPGGIPYRVSSATQDPIELKYMDGDSIIELVTLWLKEFYEIEDLFPPHPVYPFEEIKLRELAKQNPTVRQVLNWCGKNFIPPSQTNDSQQGLPQRHPVAAAFTKELAAVEESIETLLDDKHKVAAALLLAFANIIGQTIKSVKIGRVEQVEPKSENNGCIDFKIIGDDNGKTVKIGVAIIQQDNSKSVLAALRRLIAYKKFGLTRGCLVRSKEISPNDTQAQECLNQLLSLQLGGKWVSLTVEAIKPLLAILFVSRSREDYELSKEQIADFIAQNKLVVENYLIREILSPPSD